MHDDWISKYWLTYLFGLICTGMTAAVAKLWRRSKRDRALTEAVQRGVQALLRNAIIKDYNKYMEQGFCPIYARDSLSSMLREYQALGGNSTTPDLVARVLALSTELRP